ncbi:MAG: class II fructose-bisphosphate aldolase [Deltaproteobacteria bacterium]|nr:class II fructose-bisphosphate aldolase [Deltaproteobacteria bacterium]
MLVPLTKLLSDAEKGGYAIMAPDFITKHMLKLELAVAETHNSPVIISYPSLPIDKFRCFGAWTRSVLRLCDRAKVPVCLHLDHGKSVKVCLKAINAGFTSVMIDGSSFSFDENVRMTQTIVEAARKKSVSVEAEIGHVGSGKVMIERSKDDSMLTDPDEAGRFARQTGIDCLAVSIGTAHGEYTAQPNIDFDRLKAIKAQVPVPLVLHGGSGTGDDNIARAVKIGIRKINLFTEFLNPYMSETLTYYKRNPLRLLLPLKKRDRQLAVIEPVLKRYFQISGSINKGN